MSELAEKKLRISVVMVDGSFRERFHAIDAFANQNMARDDYELIWVEYYDRVSPALEANLAKYPHCRAVCLGREGVYHSSYCFNRGIVEARGEVIVIPDADVIVESDFLDKVWADHAECDRLVEYFHRWNEPEHAHREEVDMDHLRRVCELTNPANHGACISVRTKWLLEINGYDQHPVFSTGFHANDRDVYTRLNNLGLSVRWNPDVKLYHPWHPATCVHAPNYIPQHQVIAHRGTSQMTQAYRGIDPARDSDPPETLMAYVGWLQSRQLSFPRRLVRKLRKHLSPAA
ncbi:MAG: glycosyltransferase [Phycisphaeraceae bacterium]